MDKQSAAPTNRLTLLEDLNNSIKTWDGSALHATELLASNQSFFDHIQRMESLDLTVEKPIWTSLLDSQSKMMETIRVERERLHSQLEQLSKSKKVMNHYVHKNKPSLFVDKDF